MQTFYDTDTHPFIQLPEPLAIAGRSAGSRVRLYRHRGPCNGLALGEDCQQWTLSRALHTLVEAIS